MWRWRRPRMPCRVWHGGVPTRGTELRLAVRRVVQTSAGLGLTLLDSPQSQSQLEVSESQILEPRELLLVVAANVVKQDVSLLSRRL